MEQRKETFLRALTAFCVSVGLSLPVSADTEIENVTAAGSFLSSRIDANGDGSGASWCTLQIKGGYKGSSMQQCVNEDVFVGVDNDCPGGIFVVQNDIGDGYGVRTFPNAADQLFVKLTSMYFCLGTQGQATGNQEGVIIGGTGRYQGANGTFEYSYSGQLLYFDENASPPQFFGSILAEGIWEINLAD